MLPNPKYAPAATTTEPPKSQFPGVLSAISGLRYYSPSLGRFINRDPISEQGGLNLYGFCGNNGVNRWDYLGMRERKINVLADPDAPQYNSTRPTMYDPGLMNFVREGTGADYFSQTGFRQMRDSLAAAAAQRLSQSSSSDEAAKALKTLENLGYQVNSGRAENGELVSFSVTDSNDRTLGSFAKEEQFGTWLNVGPKSGDLQSPAGDRIGKILGGGALPENSPGYTAPTKALILAIARNPTVNSEIDSVWKTGVALQVETGSWVYRSNTTGTLITVRMPLEGATYDGMSPGAPPSMPGYTALLTIHTHLDPSPVYGRRIDYPSDADVIYSVDHGIPGLIKNDRGVVPYGPSPLPAPPGYKKGN